MKKIYQLIFLCLVILAASQTASAQFTVTGTITAEKSGKPLYGVNIYNKASSSGASTDLNGEFSLTLPDGAATLRITYVGYETQTVQVSPSNNTLNISLKLSASNLQETVVTGLATSVKRQNLANSITRIDAKEISGNTQPQTLDDALQGKIPGVRIQSTSGAPGGGFNVQLRGISTLGAGSSQPLYIIDGVYVNNSRLSTGRSTVNGAGGTVQDDAANRLADLNPNDIASIEVLKGPSAAAIYGQRANAGVVIIKTKQGSKGPTKVSVSQKTGFNSILKKLGRTNWTEDRIRTFYGGNPDRLKLELSRFNQAKQDGSIVDLEDKFFGNKGVIDNTTIDVSGGNDKTTFFVSGNLNNQNGIIKNSGFDRKSFRANLNHNITDHISISSKSNFINTNSDRGFTGNQNNTGGSITYTLAFTPNYANEFLRQRTDGTYPNSNYFASNPFRVLNQAENSQEINRFIQSFSLNADIAKFGASTLSFSGTGGFDRLDANSTIYFPTTLQSEASSAFPGDVIPTTQSAFNTNIKASLVFRSSTNSNFGNIQFTTQVNGSRFTVDTQLDRQRGQGLLPGQTNTENAAQISTNQNFTSNRDLGYAAQQEVNFGDKIIATVGGRFDSSTLNPDASEYFFYPKASLAINLTSFDFWKSDVFNQLKLRSAYGETGGLPNFGAVFNSLNTSNIGGRVGERAPTTDFARGLEPERAKEIEFGLDFSMFENRLSFQGTYYNKRVENLILPLNPAPSTGVISISTNAATLRNNGVELALDLIPVRKSNFLWRSTILWSTNDSKITELNIPASTNQSLGSIAFGATRIQEGVSPTAIFGLPQNTDNSTGFTKYGDFQPDFIISFSEDFTIFKNIEAGMLWQWSKGGENIDLYQLLQDSGGNTEDFFIGNTAEVRSRPGEGTAPFIQNASYLKLRRASLHYNVPVSFLHSAFGDVVKKLRFGVSGTNLLQITPFRGYDPEVNFAGTNVLIPSLAIAPYPSSRKILFSIDFDF